MRKFLLHGLVFVAAFVGTVAVVHSLDALPFWSYERSRYLLLQERLDDVDMLFVGSSRMSFSVVPAVFDSRMRELGHPVRSLNLAISGQRGYDTVATIEYVLGLEPKRLRYLVIELQTFDQRLRGTNWLTNLDVEMHTPGLFWPRLRSALSSREPWRSVYDQIVFLTAHTAANTFRVGQGRRLVGDLVAKASGRAPEGAGVFANRGYDSIEANAAADMRQAAKRFAEEAAWPKQLLDYRWSKAGLESLAGGFPVDEFLRVDALVKKARVVPIYVVMPSYYARFYGRDAVPELAERTTVLVLDLPEQHPQLFEPRFWFDPGHYARPGAGMFTRYLAEQIAALSPLQGVRQPVPPSPLQPRLAWIEGSATRLRCDLDEAGEVGDVVLRIDTATDETARADGLAHALPVQVAATLQLVRDERGNISGELDLAAVITGLPPGTLIHTQVVLLVDRKPVAVGPLTSLPTPR